MNLSLEDRAWARADEMLGRYSDVNIQKWAEQQGKASDVFREELRQKFYNGIRETLQFNADHQRKAS